jgi:hypothetical protein
LKPVPQPRRWLSAALAAGLLVMALTGAHFFYLADEVGEQAWLTRLDLEAAHTLHAATVAGGGFCFAA